jgi:hypothetical protein
MNIQSKPGVRWIPFPVKFGEKLLGKVAVHAGYYLRKGITVDNSYNYPTKREAIAACLKRNSDVRQLELED